MKMYEFKRKQFLKTSLKEAWKFIATPKNLSKITPPSMGFQTLSGDERDMFSGQIITYKVSPLLGIKFNWVTEITHVVEEKYFVDEQRFGPYKFWHHKHFLNEKSNGVEMIDEIHYALPMGFLGKLANPIIVSKKLDEIFEYRFDVLNTLFNQ